MSHCRYSWCFFILLIQRRLALKSTISIGSCFEHHLFDKVGSVNWLFQFYGPLGSVKNQLTNKSIFLQPIPERSEETFLAKRTPLANVDTFHNTASPVFDCPVPLPNLTSMRLSPTTNPEQQISSARFSLMSTTSIGSLGNGGSGDMFFCCPLVEALASPFRRRAYASNQQTPDSVRSNSINTNCSTPVGRVLRTTGRKRLRCLSPPPVQAYGLQDYNREVSSCSQSRNGELQTYYPIPPSGMLCGPKTPKRSSTLRHERTSHSQVNISFIFQRLVCQPGFHCAVLKFLTVYFSVLCKFTDQAWKTMSSDHTNEFIGLWLSDGFPYTKASISQCPHNFYSAFRNNA